MVKDFILEDINTLEFDVEVAVKEIEPPLEDVEIKPSEERQVFKSTNAYGFNTVTIDPIKLQQKELTINKNGTYTLLADDEFNGLKKVDVVTDAIEDLENELNVYNEGLTTQDNKIEDIKELLKDKIFMYSSYKPRMFTFQDYTGTELDYEISHLDTSNVTSMMDAFNTCYNVTSFNCGHFNTSNVKSMSRMFKGCSKAKYIDVSGFDTSQVTNGLGYMFDGCSVVQNLNVSSFDTSNVTIFNGVFKSCKALKHLDVSSFNTAKATYMQEMFYGCSGLTRLDLSSFETGGSMGNNSNMFTNCSNLKTIIFGGTKIFRITNTAVFSGTPIADGIGYIYVPDNLVETYKSNSNWAVFADQIKPVSELPPEEDE